MSDARFDPTADPIGDAAGAASDSTRGTGDAVWDADGVRGLRARLGLTQAELAARLGTRQQTVSEWETGASAPRRMSRRLLRIVAEEAGVYDTGGPEAGL